MSRKVIHEHKIPKSVTVALYAIAIALTLNLAKPFVDVRPAIAGYHQSAVENALSNMNSTLLMTKSILIRLEDKINNLGKDADVLRSEVRDIDDNIQSVWSAVLDVENTVSRIKSIVE